MIQFLKEPPVRRRGRPKKKNESSIRTFTLPTLNPEANHYQHMINWTTAQVTEPPFLMGMSDEELQNFVESPLVLDLPNNSQFVERMIKEITKKGCRAVDPKVRDGMVKDTNNSRKKIPKCLTKHNYQALSPSC